MAVSLGHLAAPANPLLLGATARADCLPQLLVLLGGELAVARELGPLTLAGRMRAGRADVAAVDNGGDSLVLEPEADGLGVTQLVRPVIEEVQPVRRRRLRHHAGLLDSERVEALDLLTAVELDTDQA